MKTLHLSIIIGIVLAMTVNASVPSYEQISSPSGSVLFMKSNSTAQLTVQYIFHSLQNGTQGVGIEIYNATLNDPNPLKLQGLTITVEPNIVYTNTTSTNVTYAITTNNLKGIYAYSLGYCGLSPLVIGLNESETDSLTLLKFFTAVYHCGIITDYTPEIKIINYTNIISKTITIDQSHFSPLKQMKSVGHSWNVVCKQGFQLIAKKENLSPACVNPSHITRFLTQGWTLQNTS